MTTTRGLSSFGFRTRCRGIGERGRAIAQGFGEAPALLLFLVYADVLCVPQGASAEAFGPLRHGLTCGFIEAEYQVVSLENIAAVAWVRCYSREFPQQRPRNQRAARRLVEMRSSLIRIRAQAAAHDDVLVEDDVARYQNACCHGAPFSLRPCSPAERLDCHANTGSESGINSASP